MKKTIIALIAFFWGISGTCLAWDTDQIKIHGFISQGYLKSTENNMLENSEKGSFQFNELGLNFSSELTDKLRMGLQFFSRDFGSFGNNEVIIDWAYADYRWRNWFGFRAGIIRQAHGLYNETRDIDMLRTAVLLPEGIYAENTRDFFSRLQGGSVYGEISLLSAGSLSYMFLAGTKKIDSDSAAAKWTEAAGLYEVKGESDGFFYNGSLQWHTPADGLRIGATLLRTTDFQMNTQSKIPIASVPVGTQWTLDFLEYYTYVLSVEYIRQNLKLVAEHSMSKYHTEIKNVSKRLARPFGCYAAASYRFNPWFELGAYYSVSYYDNDDKGGDYFKARGLPEYRAWQKDFALSARFDINEYWTLKLEGHALNGTLQVLPQENPDGDEKDWYLFAAKVSFSF